MQTLSACVELCSLPVSRSLHNKKAGLKPSSETCIVIIIIIMNDNNVIFVL